MPFQIASEVKMFSDRRVVSFVATWIFSIASLGPFASVCFGDDATPNTVTLGTKVQELKFKDIRSVPRSLEDLGNHRATVFAFVTTQCPIVKKTLPKLKQLYEKLQGEDVIFVCVNVGLDDTIREVAAQAIEFDVPFMFVKDYDQSVARVLGVTRTPEFAILDSSRNLVYRGRFDDQIRLGGTRATPSRADLEIALDEVLHEKEVSVPQTTTDGCLI
ncbi:MAG: redoxin domain-containing protein, partial [Planctomycetes bacterium]|nr:redoxin domain-containing protein [Planctomycetota bacterium]